ncbi:MAG TPA: hypothetical protein PKA00_21905 [Saprospiraceae bacterium]|nr:hypothetical protein [Saprospiraceae bacterium]HMQ85582.1 hypothetical protein [Saprospiraceae bacterium]
MFLTIQVSAQINSFQGTVVTNDGVNPPNEENYPWILFTFDRAALNTFLKTQGANAQFVFQVGQKHPAAETTSLENGVFFVYLKAGNGALQVELIHVFK